MDLLWIQANKMGVRKDEMMLSKEQRKTVVLFVYPAVLFVCPIICSLNPKLGSSNSSSSSGIKDRLCVNVLFYSFYSRCNL